MRVDSAVVEEWPVWLEVNGAPTVTWMCTPDQLDALSIHPSMRLRIDHYLEKRSQPYIG